MSVTSVLLSAGALLSSARNLSEAPALLVKQVRPGAGGMSGGGPVLKSPERRVLPRVDAVNSP